MIFLLHHVGLWVPYVWWKFGRKKRNLLGSNSATTVVNLQFWPTFKFRFFGCFVAESSSNRFYFSIFGFSSTRRFGWYITTVSTGWRPKGTAEFSNFLKFGQSRWPTVNATYRKLNIVQLFYDTDSTTAVKCNVRMVPHHQTPKCLKNFFWSTSYSRVKKLTLWDSFGQLLISAGIHSRHAN